MSEAPAAVTLRRALAGSSEYLARHGIEPARFEAELILAQALGLSRIQLYMDLDRPLSPDERERYRALWSSAGAGASRWPTCSASGASGA